MALSEAQLRAYRERGYVLVAGFLGADEVAAYRDEAERLANHCYERGDIVANWGCVVEPLGCGFLDSDVPAHARSSRSGYLAVREQISDRRLALCTLDRFGRCARQLLPPPPPPAGAGACGPCLLNEQFIVKPPRSDAAFAWHQDNQFLSPSQRRHAIVSVWTPLDDVCEANGTVLLDPFPDPRQPGVYPPPGTSTPTPIAACMAAGDALFMDGRLRHCSSGNGSSAFRIAYMPQFSQAPITAGDGLAALAVPLASDF
ncbi:hypothetical protein IWQ57_000033 [Coemansia nantahalensis]|uniref:Uncharacterized protein n=2 Tax=Coemansia TaxID=4863 RepID=A0ACC1L511_9FUNG|nr:hypothetical protein IWQ57_000033 [Coemansia nantahalensis]KAJ2800538.1 hypothetical protein H4R21_003133 [Coemansia helicoidea]